VIHSALLRVMYVPLAVRIRPNNGNSPSFSCVRHCKCPPHKRKTLSGTCTSPFRPVLYAFLMYTSRCTTRCYTRSHVCQPLFPSSFWSYKLRLVACRKAGCGRCGEEKHSYVSLYGNVLDTEVLWNRNCYRYSLQWCQYRSAVRV